MCIIIYYSKTVYLPLVFESSVGSFKVRQRFSDHILIDGQQFGGSNGGRCIVDIVQTGDAQPIGAFFCTIGSGQKEGGIAEFIISDIRGAVVAGRRTICDDPTAQIVRELFDLRDVPVYNERSVFGKKSGKFMERVTNIVNIFKEIQMIFFYIKNNADLWEKA